MTKIIYILLCHQDPISIIAQAEMLASQGDYVVIHFDRGARSADFSALASAFVDHPRIKLVEDRVKCGWGEWSLVQATLNAIETGLAAFPDGAYFYMVSGDCMPIKSAAALKQYLSDNPYDFIENVDFFKSYWIKTGMRQDRLIYRHWFNERARKPLFYASLNIQRFFRLKRALPANMTIKIGSQWWCLRRDTVAAVLEFAKKKRKVTRFFKTTWIPDETFFQTVVSHLIPSGQIHNRTLTFLTFTDHGMPATFYNDHFDYLVAQNAFFARKISRLAENLRTDLRDEFVSAKTDYVTDNNGLSLFRHIRTAGRTGGRDGATFWAKGDNFGDQKSLWVLSCADPEYADVLRKFLASVVDFPVLGFVYGRDRDQTAEVSKYFPNTPLTPPEAVQMTRFLFEFHGGDRMLCFVEPTQIGIIADIAAGQNDLRILHVDGPPKPEELAHWVDAMGLTGPATPPAITQQAMTTIANAWHTSRQAFAAFPWVKQFDMSSDTDPATQAIQLANFANITIDQATSVLGQTQKNKD